MAKRKTFEDLLQTEFRWPRKGDAPFQKSERWDQNACIAQDKFSRLVIMMSGYKRAADLMVERAMSERAERDFLVFPIIFNYRQFIELSLKYIIFTYGHTVGVDPNWRSHDLAYLWSKLSEILDGYGTEDPDEADLVVAEVVAEFSKIDPDSYSYRYPVDTHGQPIPLSHEELDLEALADVMEAVENYFGGCDGYLDHLQSAA